MLTEKEIKNIHKQLHDDLSEIYYGQEPKGQLSKEEFESLHGQIWDTMRDDLITEGHLTIPEPPRDLLAEIDELKASLDKITELNGVA